MVSLLTINSAGVDFLSFSGLASESYLEACQTSKMDHFAKIVNGFYIYLYLATFSR